MATRTATREKPQAAPTAADGVEAAAMEDVGNIIALEHVNITVPDPVLATQFYINGLGLTRDPYMMVGAENMWVNVGYQQFHLPTRAPQVIPGHIALVLPSLEALQQRLKAVEARLAGTQFAWSVEDGCVAVTCPWGNRIRCFSPRPEFGSVALGLPHVEFLVKRGAADGIARFYREVMGAPVALKKEKGAGVARVRIGQQQALIFREAREDQRPYDGHHVAIYVANFSGPYRYFERHGLVLQGVAMHQYRFKDIVDPATGKKLFELEHEVRSLYHPMFMRELVNRDPTQTLRAYARGHDALRPACKGLTSSGTPLRRG